MVTETAIFQKRGGAPGRGRTAAHLGHDWEFGEKVGRGTEADEAV